MLNVSSVSFAQDDDDDEKVEAVGGEQEEDAFTFRPAPQAAVSHYTEEDDEYERYVLDFAENILGANGSTRTSSHMSAVRAEPPIRRPDLNWARQLSHLRVYFTPQVFTMVMRELNSISGGVRRRNLWRLLKDPVASNALAQLVYSSMRLRNVLHAKGYEQRNTRAGLSAVVRKERQELAAFWRNGGEE